MKPDRRHWVLAAGVACAAAAVGAGVAIVRQRSGKSDEEAVIVSELLSSTFEKPNGGQLDMASLRGHPLALNFWATWCPPCIREMPTLDRFQRDVAARGWRVVGLAADEEGPVRAFLTHTPVSYAIGLTGFAGIDLARRLGNLAGGLPFTVLIGSDGMIRQRHSGELGHEQLASWAKGIG